MTDYISSKRIQGTGPIGAKVLVIGEAPYGEAESQNLPLAGEPLTILERAFPSSLSSVRYMNLSEYKPANNDFAYLEGSNELRASLSVLDSYIQQHRPELIIGLGERVLRNLVDLYNVNDWRGSPLTYKGIKFLPTYSPHELVYRKGVFPIFQFDLQKAFDYLNNKHRVYTDNFTITNDQMEMMNLAEEILSAPVVTIDIETRRTPTVDLLCVGFGLSPERAICFVTHNDSAKDIIRSIVARIKHPIYHNSLFDVAIFRYFHDIPATPAYFDTMVAQHVLEPEMPKGLDFLCSTLTWRPCYWAGITFNENDKSHSERQTEKRDLYRYNCMDVCVTYEAYEILSKDLASSKNLKSVFDYEMEMLEVSHHMSSTGFQVDVERKNLIQTILEERRKKDYTFLCALAGKGVLISSPKQVKEYLYEELGLPARRNREGKVTTDNDALVSLVSYCKTEKNKLKTEEARSKWDLKIAVLRLILNIRGYDKLLSSYINIEISKDGRMRGIFKVAATETGRLAGGTWWDKTGLNAQTLPRESIEYEAD